MCGRTLCSRADFQVGFFFEYRAAVESKALDALLSISNVPASQCLALKPDEGLIGPVEKELVQKVEYTSEVIETLA